MTSPPYGAGPHSGPDSGPEQWPGSGPGYGPPPAYGPPAYGPPPGFAAPGYAVPGYAAPGYGYPYAPPPYVPPPPKPGCVPLRPLGLGDILDGAFKMIRRNPKVMLGLSAGVAVVQVLLVAIGELVLFAQVGNVSVTSSSDPTADTSVGSAVLPQFVQLITLVVGTLLGAVLTGMLTLAVTQDVIGVRMSVGQVWARVKGRIWALIGLAILTTVLEFSGLLLVLLAAANPALGVFGAFAGAALGIWLWGIWTVSVPALVVEGTTIRGALGRSRLLVTGTFWRVWGIRALGALIASFIGGFIAAPFLIAGIAGSSGDIFATDSTNAATPVLFVILTAIGSAVSSTFTAPLRAGIDALLYVDLRMRKEGLDIVLQQAAAGTGSFAPRAEPPAPRTAF